MRSAPLKFIWPHELAVADFIASDFVI